MSATIPKPGLPFAFDHLGEHPSVRFQRVSRVTTALLTAAVAFVLILVLAFGWASASDRADQIENERDARERRVQQLETRLRRTQRELELVGERARPAPEQPRPPAAPN